MSVVMCMHKGKGGSTFRTMETGLKMALYCNISPATDNFPDPNGQLSKKIPSSTIVKANEVVRNVATEQLAKSGTYAKFTTQQQAKVAQYASMHRITAAKLHFSKELHLDLKESTIRTLKTKYLSEISHKKQSGDIDMNMTELMVKK